MRKHDRQGARTPAQLERKYDFEQRFDDAMDAASKASKSADTLDSKLDQGEILNRLTRNGKAQGLFRDDEGNLYINASYLAAGILSSKDGKTFYLDLEKGILKGEFTEFTIAGKSVTDIADVSSNTAQKQASAYAERAAQKAVESQTQEDVFNKLTNYGEAGGIYYVDGQLYINATYLGTGELKSADGTTFYLNLKDNTLRILGKTVSWKQGTDGTYTLVGK